MPPMLIAVDQGTTSTKCILFDSNGAIVEKCSFPHQTRRPSPLLVEQDALEIFHNVEAGIRQLTRKAGAPIAAISLSTQTGAFVLWDKDTGQPLTPIIGWQDRRGENACQRLTSAEKQELEALGYLPLGNTIPMRLMELKKTHPQLWTESMGRRLAFGTIDCWLIYCLTRKKTHACNACNASITRMFDSEAGQWNSALLERLQLPQGMFPQVLPDDGIFGRYDGGIPITGVMGDSAGAMFGQRCFHRGDVKVTYGTGVSYLLHIGNRPVPPPSGFALSVVWNRSGEKAYAWEGTVAYAGAALTWLEEKSQTPLMPILSGLTAGERLAAEDGLFFAPGESRTEAGFIGETAATTLKQRVQAVLEAIAFQVLELALRLKREAGLPLPERLAADGGISASAYCLQLQAELFRCPVVCGVIPECSALGCAMMSALAVGMYPSEADLPAPTGDRRSYAPSQPAQKMEKLYQNWKWAVYTDSAESETEIKS